MSTEPTDHDDRNNHSDHSAHVVEEDGRVRVELRGELTERFVLASVRPQLRDQVVLDLAGITRINSPGIRQWINFLQEAESRAESVRLQRCSVAFTRQLSLVGNAGGGAQIDSVMAPYFCDLCRAEDARLVEVSGGEIPDVDDDVPCPECGEPMEFDDFPDVYFSFLKG